MNETDESISGAPYRDLMTLSDPRVPEWVRAKGEKYGNKVRFAARFPPGEGDEWRLYDASGYLFTPPEQKTDTPPKLVATALKYLPALLTFLLLGTMIYVSVYHLDWIIWGLGIALLIWLLRKPGVQLGIAFFLLFGGRR